MRADSKLFINIRIIDEHEEHQNVVWCYGGTPLSFTSYRSFK